MGWMKELQIALACAACAVFDLDPDSQDAADFVRYAYQDSSTTSQAPLDKDVLYVSLSAAQGDGRQYNRTIYTDDGAQLWRNVPLSCLFTFYGPTADENAHRLMRAMSFDGGADTPRAILRSYHMVLTRLPGQPTSFPEIVDGEWRYRSDVRVDLMHLHCEKMSYGHVDPDQGIDITIDRGVDD